MKTFCYMCLCVLGCHYIVLAQDIHQQVHSDADLVAKTHEDTKIIIDKTGLSSEEVQFLSRLSTDNQQIFTQFSSNQRQLAMQIAGKYGEFKNPITPDIAVESVYKYSQETGDHSFEQPDSVDTVIGNHP